MELSGGLLKMKSDLGNTVNYALPIGNEFIDLMPLIGQNISFRYLKEINCIVCGRKTNKSFFQGMCYPCFKNAPEAEECVLRPELCTAHEGVARDMDYARQHCLQEHIVYLSYTGNIKVGVTRKPQIPTRWIDQGATSALILAITPNRNLAGKIEVLLKDYIADKTNWRTMLKTSQFAAELQEKKANLKQYFTKEYEPYFKEETEIVNINYTVLKYPQKVTSVGFDKEQVIVGKLNGIKGQYLIFDDGRVLNVRKHGGYKVTLSY